MSTAMFRTLLPALILILFPVSARAENTGTQHYKAGRELFSKRDYAGALRELQAALEALPDDKDARLLAALSAYWARKPDVALEMLNTLVDKARRNSDDEWNAQRHRVAALNDLGQSDAADIVIERLYEMHREKLSPAAAAASGFTRENIYINDLRIGAFEVFDERNEARKLFDFPISSATSPDDGTLKTISVEHALLPGGEAGSILSEEGPGYRKIYKRWLKRPDYSEVRPLVLGILQGKLPPIEEKKLDNQADYSTPLSQPHAGAEKPKQRKVTLQDLQLSRDIQNLGLDPALTRILLVAGHLRQIQFDVTKLTWLSISDPELARQYLHELDAKEPFAQEDAAELVDLISKAKTEQLAGFYENLNKMGPRTAYLDFVLLTAMNTRGRDISPALLEACTKSSDFMVRQTAGLLLARQGEIRGLELLFAEAEKTDAIGCSILGGSLQESLGDALPALGAKTEQAANDWRKLAAAWWKQNRAKIKFAPDAKADEPYWK